MRSLTKKYLALDEEIYRLLTTMVKKMKLSKKGDTLILTETVSEIMWLSQIMAFKPRKYSVILEDEEAAKVIFYLDHEKMVFYDLYVNPKYRKQGLAKSLVAEVMGDHRDIPFIQFHARETNKPVRNLVAFFVAQFLIPQEVISIHIAPAFYIDGGKAIIYSSVNPANYLDRKDAANEVNKVPETRRLSGVDSTVESGPQIPVQD
jgi:predicted GNAT family acetyltransferase